ncbi:hypothetical protein J4733_15985 [Klebsiella pneumoniae]|uniref:UmuC domain-containing protein n=1 Tax=Klebsiella pneumoniae TaxID=573 RepID=A0A939NNQ6_KLEPN|nr:hypothetical protein [Klebsiella pneumoniae]
MDCFFCGGGDARQPSVARYSLAIGGSRVQRGVISTANHPARKFACAAPCRRRRRLAVPASHAASGRFDAYKEASNHIREIFSRYTCALSRCRWMKLFDVSDSEHCHGSATLIAQTIERELRLTASAG